MKSSEKQRKETYEKLDKLFEKPDCSDDFDEVWSVKYHVDLDNILLSNIVNYIHDNEWTTFSNMRTLRISFNSISCMPKSRWNISKTPHTPALPPPATQLEVHSNSKDLNLITIKRRTTLDDVLLDIMVHKSEKDTNISFTWPKDKTAAFSECFGGFKRYIKKQIHELHYAEVATITVIHEYWNRKDKPPDVYSVTVDGEEFQMTIQCTTGTQTDFLIAKPRVTTNRPP